MKKIIFDMNPLGSFSLSCKAYIEYFKRKSNKNIYVYTRCSDGTYLRVDDLSNERELKNRILTFVDLGRRVSEIPFDDNIRVNPIDEDYEEDEILKVVIEKLGDDASWKNSNLKVVEVE
ncbi:hypothetical protein [Anaerosphaera multitolerans]|uniref:Uncharacterized protein n=1 Tax=Anaerosphaera multitolerans TaxID=2487351 RepID=A0A437S8H7_9FIRM|nr:hypothetical protein [Anaerosphaera multitolerans]RVU55241.1 hypothetical protein EF514_02930 [Anaerosphaera multitolerans]